ncbi:MAG: HD domain-containing protein [Thermodesulfobacteriota bacterium]
MDSRYPRIYELAKPLLATRDNEIHTRIAFRFALTLLAAEGGNEAVILPAVLLHDIGWSSVPERLQLKAFGPGQVDRDLNRIHEVEGAKKAREILERVGYDPDLTNEIVEIIAGHDSRRDALSLNDAIVKDSDKLWRFSEEALEVDPRRFRVHPAVHAQWLKQKIDRWFLTRTARDLAREEIQKRILSCGLPPAND